MEVATLALFITDTHILLGRKKTGQIGKGKFNGPGGKVQQNESIFTALVRECVEEVCSSPTISEEVAILSSLFGDDPAFRVHVFRVEAWEGETQETKDMQPAWFLLDHIPYQNMHEADQYWLPRVLSGEKFNATIRYESDGVTFIKIDLSPHASVNELTDKT